MTRDRRPPSRKSGGATADTGRSEGFDVAQFVVRGLQLAQKALDSLMISRLGPARRVRVRDGRMTRRLASKDRNRWQAPGEHGLSNLGATARYSMRPPRRDEILPRARRIGRRLGAGCWTNPWAPFAGIVKPPDTAVGQTFGDHVYQVLVNSSSSRSARSRS